MNPRFKILSEIEGTQDHCIGLKLCTSDDIWSAFTLKALVEDERIATVELADYIIEQ